MGRVPIGQLLISQGRLDAVQLESALAHQRRWGGRLGRSIISLGFLDEGAVLSAVGEQLGVPFIHIGATPVPRQVLALVPEKLIRTRRVLPLSRESERRRGPLLVAMPDPLDLHVLDEVAFAAGMEARPALAAEADLDQAIARLLDGRVVRSSFASREDAIDLPEDTNPLSALRRDGNGRNLLH